MQQVTDVFFQQIQGALAGRYQVERQIGRGATATVYLARDLKHDRPVAVKVLRPELSAAIGGERFLLEIKVAAGLQHPHILPLYDSGDAGGTLYYVMPFVEGESLRDRLNREPKLPLDDALRIAREVADALAYAHEADIVHRDIKPENILLSDGHAVVADFGIARAINRAGGEGLTETGMAIGTPVYMSPEQASAERAVDGRTDIYSLGCVLYEMLAGKPPFTGPTTFAVIAHRLSDPPDKLRGIRPEIPEDIERAVERSLADDPADRYRTATEFEDALGGRVYPDRQPKRTTKWIAAGLVAAAAVAIAGWLMRPSGAALDDSLYVVLPFEHRMGAAPTLLNGNQCEILLHDALARWNDLKLVPEVRVNDARARLASASLSVDDALRIARELGARHLAWGEVSQVRDSVLVRAYLYDVADPKQPPRERSVRLGSDLSRAGVLFEELADSLLLGAAKSRNSVAAAMNTSSLAAWRMYDAGHEALRDWNLDSAAAAFRAATARDPEFPNAQLMLAQTLSWTGAPLGAWNEASARAVTLMAKLPARERNAAEGLAALANLRFADACAKYSAMVRADSSDFAGWYGLGECHARDQGVIADAKSASGWRFRSSYQAGINAYRRALELVPSAQAAFAGPELSRLQRMMFTELRHFRSGQAVGSDSLVFAAFPTLDADSITFVPYPFQDVMDGRAPLNAAGRNAAVARMRATLRKLTGDWVAAFPRSAEALRMHGAALEVAGEIGESSPGGESALTVVRRARGIASEPAHAVGLAIDETRLLLKAGEWSKARALADSLLSAATPSADVAEELSALAALLGRADQSARLLRMSADSQTPLSLDGRPVMVALPVAQTALSLLAYASLGAPRDSLVTVDRRLESQVQSWVQPPLRKRVREALLERPLQLAFPELGYVDAGTRTPGGYLRSLQRALVQRDTAGVRRDFARIAAIRSEQRPGDVSVDMTYQEVFLQLALGDTAEAIARLDGTLDGLATLGSALLSQPPQAAALPRAMALRARIAARGGDAATARKWATAVVALWSGADRALQPTVDEMRTLSGAQALPNR